MSCYDYDVGRNILVKARFIPGDAGSLRTGILAAPGAQSAVGSSGGLRALHDWGLFDKFSAACGSSAGGPNIAFLLSGEGPYGIKFYWMENRKGFINPWRFWKIVDISHLEHGLRHRRVLDVHAVRNNPTEFAVTLTGLDGVGMLYDAKEHDDLIVPIVATCCLPIVWHRPRDVDGEMFLDGAIAMPLPVVEFATKYQLTDLLVMLSQPARLECPNVSLIERVASSMLVPYSRKLQRAFLERQERYNASLAVALSGWVDNGTPQGCRVAVVAPSYAIKPHCTDPGVLQEFAQEGYFQMMCFLEPHRASVGRT